MTLQMILVGLGVFALFVVYAVIRLKQANREIESLMKTVETVKQEKAVAQTQVQHFETRKKNEEKSLNADRTALIERMQQSGDFRD